MNAFIEKFGPNATLVVRAFAIAKRNNRQLQVRELTILKQAVDVVVPHLAGTSGMTSIEFDVLLFHVAVIKPEERLDFLNTAAEIIKVTRPEGWFTEYDMWFLKFVSQLLDALPVAQLARQGESSAPVSFAADSTLQASVSVLAPTNNPFQAWSGNTSQTASSDASILSESGVASCRSISSSLLSATNTSATAYMVSSGGAKTSSSTLGSVHNFEGTNYLGSTRLPETQAPGSFDGSQNADFPDWLANPLDYDLAALIDSIGKANMG
ncbi:uncharacterized protein FTOL_08957 [Fusarium torulosum]|uniref:Uncharacterized protein n=1 Tax=Fusarium torulosum TaxID=33205 RepID=A0AAE8MDM7_9HYPO|nr:uncharacterized protein FTOL_08957 [Fusarium torulosum]